MKRTRFAFGTLALALLATFATILAPSIADAACIPDPSLSYCYADVVRLDACPAGSNTLVWCPAGDLSLIRVTIGVLDTSGSPCPGCPVDVDFRFQGESNIPGCDLWVCGTTLGSVTLSGVTNAVGEATFTFTGGGCGCLSIDWLATAGPLVLCVGGDRFCVKSPDMTGDGTINFFDVFKYLPQLSSGQGYCGDLNCDNTVNFFDTFVFLPHYGGGHNCAGDYVPFLACPSPPLCF